MSLEFKRKSCFYTCVLPSLFQKIFNRKYLIISHFKTLKSINQWLNYHTYYLPPTELDNQTYYDLYFININVFFFSFSNPFFNFFMI